MRKSKMSVVIPAVARPAHAPDYDDLPETLEVTLTLQRVRFRSGSYGFQRIGNVDLPLGPAFLRCYLPLRGSRHEDLEDLG